MSHHYRILQVNFTEGSLDFKISFCPHMQCEAWGVIRSGLCPSTLRPINSFQSSCRHISRNWDVLDHILLCYRFEDIYKWQIQVLIFNTFEKNKEQHVFTLSLCVIYSFFFQKAEQLMVAVGCRKDSEHSCGLTLCFEKQGLTLTRTRGHLSWLPAVWPHSIHKRTDSCREADPKQ